VPERDIIITACYRMM